MAKNTTLLALAAALTALASAITEECNSPSGGGAAPDTKPDETLTGDAPAGRRGRPAKPADAPKPKTMEELKEIIEPLVKGKLSIKIKAILKDDFDILQMKDLPDEKQGEFLAKLKPLFEELEANAI
jgi:hypothetical protein